MRMLSVITLHQMPINKMTCAAIVCSPLLLSLSNPIFSIIKIIRMFSYNYFSDLNWGTGIIENKKETEKNVLEKSRLQPNVVLFQELIVCRVILTTF